MHTNSIQIEYRQPISSRKSRGFLRLSLYVLIKKNSAQLIYRSLKFRLENILVWDGGVQAFLNKK